ncbi:hypothetical protein NIES970_02050 [[Synechococcus] sp. NIES-970]|uniref:hypothetical protein n=1 Tax=Picosynechococcus sp. NKBG15041c TaxID=1407650 RepID=UPI0004044CDA|nr:hypothetical protein [Picosynechococcus sp. NKBG15041c]BAW95302.1 hypothetical protein NIES970_02050 [[Synechococcus] sp. NIES-970]
MKKFHLAIATNNLTATIQDYSQRLGADPCIVIENEYALWRTETLNISIRHDSNCPTGTVRHVGWEDPTASEFSQETDVNGLIWERFSAADQATEINNIWPGINYRPQDSKC